MQKDSYKIALAVAETKLEEMLVWILKAWGYIVVIVEREEEVVEYIKRESPALIIIDSSFQGKRGLEICKNIKHDFLTAYTPTIILIDKRQLRRDLLIIEEGVDDYLIKPPDPIDLEVRIILALRSAAHHFDANALTGLPGNRLINKELNNRLRAKKEFSFLYIDIDNFKSYNDKYGYLKGDEVITETAKIISKKVKEEQNKNEQAFLGHIGGDDFAVISSCDDSELIAKGIIRDFDSRSSGFYSQADKKNGFIISSDRTGKTRRIPLMSLSIAIVNNSKEAMLNLLMISDISSEIKKHLKELPGSNFMVNRRVLDHGIDNRQGLKSRF
ncbi:MAG: hypothetical protein DRP74_00020 [Candidatus Omnitrophota bacterium]|nr:MAG: hypothetical protein DRP74_00020 [Candidatus Omnitrophota bacterium]